MTGYLSDGGEWEHCPWALYHFPVWLNELSLAYCIVWWSEARTSDKNSAALQVNDTLMRCLHVYCIVKNQRSTELIWTKTTARVLLLTVVLQPLWCGLRWHLVQVFLAPFDCHNGVMRLKFSLATTHIGGPPAKLSTANKHPEVIVNTDSKLSSS